MIFHMPQKQITTPKLEIDGTSLEFVNSFNYLDINIDKHLNWQDHINSIANKLAKYIGILNKLKKICIAQNFALDVQLFYS